MLPAAVVALCLALSLFPARLSAESAAVDPNDAADVIGDTPDPPVTPTPRKVVSLTTSFNLNGIELDHSTRAEASFGTIGGNDRNLAPILRGTIRVHADMNERRGQDLFIREQDGWYVQGQTFNRIRDVTLNRSTPVDVIGLDLKFSLTGTCVFPGHPPDAYCSYTPGLSIDPLSLDPDLFVPTRFFIDSGFGDEVDSAAMAAIRQPGWQRGAQGGKRFGLDLLLPNSGYVFSEARRGEGGVTRRETVDVEQILSFSRVRQQLVSNDDRAALTRTIRGLALPAYQDWSDRAVGWQLLALLLPGLQPGLSAGAKPPYLEINNNLFLASNNARLPRDSLTLYHSGVASVVHAKGPVTRLADIPHAIFHGIWLGLSPIIDRVQTNRLRLQMTGTPEVISSTFSQGGSTSGIAQISGLTLIESMSGVQTAFDLNTLQDPFLQFGLTLTKQPAYLTQSSQLIETTRYVPSLSITGTRTGAEHVWRYYAGAMEGEDPDALKVNSYLGGDWTYNGANGWRLHFGAIGYTQPNYDYFSEANARIGKIFQLPRETKLTLATAAAYSFDRPGDFENFVLDYDGSRLDVSAQVERRKLNLSVTQGIAEVLPDSRAPYTTVGIGYRLTPQLELSARYTPYSEQTSYLRAQAGLTWRPTEKYGSPSLRLQWSQIQYNYGENSLGDPLGATEDVLMLVLQMRFNAS